MMFKFKSSFGDLNNQNIKMGFIKRAQKFSIYLMIFSLNFESIDLFYLGISYLATKISIVLLLFFSVLNFKNSFTFRNYSNYILIIVSYFLMLTVNNFINRSGNYNKIIDFPFFLNLLVFVILCNYSMVDKKVILKGLLVLSLSSFLLVIFYFLGLGGEGLFEGRFTIFGMNENILGLTLCISILTLLSIVFENNFFLDKKRYLFLVMVPFLFVLMLNTGSRGAFISLLLGISSFLYFKKSITPLKKYSILAITVFTSILLWFLFLKTSVIGERLLSSVNEGDLGSRELIWISIYDVIVNNYIIGIGETGYAEKMMNWFNDVPSPHNVFIEIICYTGLVGLIVFLIFLKRLYYNARKINLQEGGILSLALFFPIIITMLSGQLLDSKLIWVLFAFIASNTPEEKDIIT